MKEPAVRVRQESKVKWVKNPISGHEWPEETLLNKFTIIHKGIEVAETKTYEKALKLKQEWEEFHNKFFI